MASIPYLSFDNQTNTSDSKHTSDFYSFHTPADVLAPHPDLFESELDSSLAAFDQSQLQLLPVEQPDPFAFLRSDTPTCGPPSTFTVSSAESVSAYESLSSQSTESYYNYNATSDYSNYSFDFDIDMDLARVRLQGHRPSISADSLSDYSTGKSVDDHDLTSFGALPTSPAQNSGSVYSDYGSDYFPSVPSHPSLNYNSATISPSNLTSKAMIARAPSPIGTGLSISLLPSISGDIQRRASAPSDMVDHISGPAGSNQDERKKYQCTQCPRAFARAYNLKTHMGTHDPNRPKPHVCPYSQCARSFSRKHDLGRHLVSIHRDEPGKGVGIGALKDARKWCDACGKSTIGRPCGCTD